MQEWRGIYDFVSEQNHLSLMVQYNGFSMEVVDSWDLIDSPKDSSIDKGNWVWIHSQRSAMRTKSASWLLPNILLHAFGPSALVHSWSTEVFGGCLNIQLHRVCTRKNGIVGTHVRNYVFFHYTSVLTEPTL